jgi:hypothetical protein
LLLVACARKVVKKFLSGDPGRIATNATHPGST